MICGKKTLKKNVSGYHPLNATIGHIVSLSKRVRGHTMSNVQLECHECNTLKGTRDYGQLRLDIY